MKKNNKLAIKIEEQANDSPFSNNEGYLQHPLRPNSLPDSDEERVITQNSHHPSKVIQFEEFLVDQQSYQIASKEGSSSGKPSQDKDNTTRPFLQDNKSAKTKRDFKIEIPQDGKSHRQQMFEGLSVEKKDYKQPPAPSHKKSFKAKNFVFPASVIEKQSPQKDGRLQIEELLRNFDKERQQFYRQKSKFQKQLLVKQGQIEMLQKMLTGRIGNEQLLPNQNYQYFQTLILEKDLQINELLQKISSLSKQLCIRGQELRGVKLEMNRLQNVNESLLHQIYLLQKKQVSKKTTQQFYDMKRQKPTTPTARDWDFDMKKEDTRYSGAEKNLKKRLDELKNNRIDFQDSHRNQLNYTQPQIRFKRDFFQHPYDYKTNKF